MLPGETYTPEAILQIIVRRLWILILLAAIGAGLAHAVAKRLPNQYRSETLILFEPQQVPYEYVKSFANGGIDLVTLQGQILSRSRLERIIAELHLYPSLRAAAPLEVVVERMRADIAVNVDTKSSFRLAFVSEDAGTAQRVADRLSSFFIEESLRERKTLAIDTNGFLDSQLEGAKRQLIEHEKKLEEYRLQFGRELPSQAPMNLQGIQNSQTQLQALIDATDRARERRLLLERQLDDLESEAAVDVGSGEPAAGSTAQQLATARQELQTLLTRAKPDHPDVRSLRRTIRDLEAKLSAEESAPRTASKTAVRLKPAELQRQQRRRDLTEQIADIDRQLAARQRQENLLRGMVAQYEAKLNAAPKRESELVELTRDYATLQATYQSLLSKRQEAKIAADLEQRNIGPQFKVLDPAKVPEQPFSPNRPLINLGGAGAGLGLGLLLIALLEYRRSWFATDAEIERLLNLPVLAVVPRIVSRVDHRARRRRFVVAGVAAAITAVVVVLLATKTQLPF